ncbi:MAG: hypothetical protein QHH06_10375 [Clostridiales bacterium]|nr:hypothetical protein [Eubacteriales bacterium]MDH7566871.1 hypothetical protein [Clostridiales bacterium]
MLTHEKYLERFNEKWKGEYTLIGTYVKSDVPILLRHNKCGMEYEKPANEALRYGCKYCADRSKNLIKGLPEHGKQRRIAEAKSKFLSFLGNEYELLSEYTGCKDRVSLRHLSCGRVFSVRPTDFIYRNARCNCEIQRALLNKRLIRVLNKRIKNITQAKMTHDEFISNVKEIWGDEFEILSEFKGLSKKVLVKHKSCGNIYEKYSDTLLKKHGCMYCSRTSSMVIAVQSILERIGVSYKREVKINECRRKRALSFDFAVYNNVGEISLLIEVDGEQHWRATELTGGEKKLQETMERDEIKNNYCLINNIRLVRIKGIKEDLKDIEAIIKSRSYEMKGHAV